MAYIKSEAGKGDDDRTKNWKAYWSNYDNIFKKNSTQNKKTDSEHTKAESIK